MRVASDEPNVVQGCASWWCEPTRSLGEGEGSRRRQRRKGLSTGMGEVRIERRYEAAPTRFDIDVDFDGGGTAGDVHTWIHLADDDPG